MKAYYAAFIREDDGRYSVLFPDVPGCQTWGNTMEESFAYAIEALEGHLEALAEDGDEIPVPTARAEAWRRMREIADDLELELPADTVLQLIPAPDLSRTVKATMSFRAGTLEMIDRKAEALGMKRSAFVAAAARYYPASENERQASQG